MDSYPSENKTLNNRKMLNIFDAVIWDFLVMCFLLSLLQTLKCQR